MNTGFYSFWAMPCPRARGGSGGPPRGGAELLESGLALGPLPAPPTTRVHSVCGCPAVGRGRGGGIRTPPAGPGFRRMSEPSPERNDSPASALTGGLVGTCGAAGPAGARGGAGGKAKHPRALPGLGLRPAWGNEGGRRGKEPAWWGSRGRRARAGGGRPCLRWRPRGARARPPGALPGLAGRAAFPLSWRLWFVCSEREPGRDTAPLWKAEGQTGSGAALVIYLFFSEKKKTPDFLN